MNSRLWTNEEQDEARTVQVTLGAGFLSARRASNTTITGIDLQTLEYHYPELTEVVTRYIDSLSGEHHAPDFRRIREHNPLAPYIENMARRHR